MTYAQLKARELATRVFYKTTDAEAALEAGIREVLADAAKEADAERHDNAQHAAHFPDEHPTPAWDRAFSEGCLSVRDRIVHLADREVPPHPRRDDEHRRRRPAGEHRVPNGARCPVVRALEG